MTTVFFDIDTQLDFLDSSGALYVPGAEAIVDRIAALNHWAARHAIPVISTMDAHTPDDPEFRDWPPHCSAGTPGQRKPPSTLLEKRIIVPNTPGLPETAGFQQILLEKQSLDCFTNVNLPALLERLGAERCVVYGVVTEICVKFAAFGLLGTGHRVELVSDAIKELDPTAAAKTISDFLAAGGTLTTSEQFLITKTLLTADDLARMPDDASVQIELDEGELITMPPAGEEHGYVEVDLTLLLGNFVKAKKLGRVYAGDTGFRLNDQTDFAPDVAFVRQERVEAVRSKSFANGAPDLAVEIFSPSDGVRQSTRKVKQYLAAGCHTVWVVYPKSKKVVVFEASGAERTLHSGDALEAPGLLPGFSVKVAELFG